MNKRLAICFFAILLFCISACSRNQPSISENKSDYTNDTATVSEPQAFEADVDKESIEGSLPSRETTLLSSNMTWEEDLDYGSLIYTITNSQVITNISAIGMGGFRADTCLCIYDAKLYEAHCDDPWTYVEGYETVYNYPAFLDETGQLIDNSCMIIIDITVTNRDATNRGFNPYTKEDHWDYENPYLFRADSILCLIDTTDKLENGSYRYSDAVFFSGLGIYPEHSMAYELLPGDTTSFRIGFLVGNKRDGTERNISELVVSNSWGSLDNVYFTLNLVE